MERIPEASDRMWLSARTGAGVDALCARLLQRMQGEESEIRLRLPLTAYSLRAELHRVGQVEEEKFTEEGECEMRLRLPLPYLARFEKFRVAVPLALQETVPGPARLPV